VSRLQSLMIFLVMPCLLLSLVGCTDHHVTSSVKSSDGTLIAYESQGTGSPALVFVHGWSCDRSYWSEQTEFFAADHQVVLIDLAGHGDSGRGRNDWTIPAYAQDIKAVMADLGLDQVILIGHSMAGSVVAEAGALVPDQVVGLIGIDTLHDIEEHYTEEQITGFSASMEANFPVAAQAFVRSMFLADADSALVESIASDMSSAPPAIAISSIRQYLGWSIIGALDSYQPKVRCINAGLWPSNIEHGLAHCSEFTVRTMDGAGHFLFMEKPNEFNSILAEEIATLTTSAP
jgi:pimeloyl-ACP methyl ester carboxylesterase